jgi:prephenate dehydrogenase
MTPDEPPLEAAGGESVPDPFRTVVVVGLGLMGGSLARALKAVPDPPGVLGVDPDPLQGSLALEAGAVDRFDPEGIGFLGEADLVVYAAPLGETLRMLREHRGLWRDDALITDVVSLKAPLLGLAAREGFGERIVGSHPLCGGEGSGFGASREDLFRGAVVFLCRDEGTSEASASRAERLWQALGARAEWIDAEEHDRRMAWVSHLPQLVANALAGALDAAGWSPDDLGPGGRDMTRLAGSSPAVWKDLLTTSAPITGAGLTSVSRALNVLADLLARRDMARIAEFMERTREWRSGGEGE